MTDFASPSQEAGRTHQVNSTPSKPFGRQKSEEKIFCDKPEIFDSAKKHLPSVEDQKHSGAKIKNRPKYFVLANELVRFFEQISLKKLTFKELLKFFGGYDNIRKKV